MSDRQVKSELLLGRRIASYHALDPSRLPLIALAVVGLCGSLLGASGWTAEWASRWILVGGLACLVVTGVTVNRRRTVRRIDLYQKGLYWIHGRRQTVVLWDQIRELYQIPVHSWTHLPGTVPDPDAWIFRLVCRDGRRLTLAGFEGMRGLGRRIQHETAHRMLPLVLESFRSGYLVRFGRRIAVSEQGLHLGFKCLPWHEVADVAVNDTHAIRIALAGHTVRWVKVPIGQVANVHILTEILEQMRNAAAKVIELNEPAEDGAGVLAGSDLRTDLDHELSDLAEQGYDLDDIHEVIDGECTMEELIARGPRNRPRHPR